MASQNAENSEMMASFIGITGVDEERASFFLQSTNWDLPTALEMFYDDPADEPVVSESLHDVSPRAESMETVPQPAFDFGGSSNKVSTSARKKDGNFVTLSSYQDDDNPSEGEEGQAYYAGGSERSGQQIIGPDKKSKNPTKKLFEAAKQHGAEMVPEKSTDNKKSSKNIFHGAGYTLGSDVEPSQQVSASLTRDTLTSEPQNVVIKFWSNGFSVDSGPLRDFNDPLNKIFLDSIEKGEVPAELRSAARNSEVHVNMEDHREEEYVKPKETLKAFSGAGQKLGSPTPTIVKQETSSPINHNIENEGSTYIFNESKPVTSIQIRLADGTRLVAKFNHDSTVGDIRNVVRNARPNNQNFNLMTTFPNKILSDDNITIADAKLLNAVIVQRVV